MTITNGKEVSHQKADIQSLLMYIFTYGSQEDIDMVERWIVNVARWIQYKELV